MQPFVYKYLPPKSSKSVLNWTQVCQLVKSQLHEKAMAIDSTVVDHFTYNNKCDPFKNYLLLRFLPVANVIRILCP